MADRPWKHLGGEELRKRAKRADARLGYEIDRLQIQDAAFRAALLLALDLEQETEHRRNS